VGAFLEALHVELDLRADALDRRFGTDRPPLESLYLGGGTPSLLPAEDVTRLVEHVRYRYGLASDAEVTLEANPGPADRGDLAGFCAAGVNRLSLGVQVLDAGGLRTLGRRHTPRDAAEAVADARQAGFANLSVDLLYDLPGQSLAGWERTLDGVLALEVEHVSAYALTLDDPDAEGLTGPLGDHLPTRPGARGWRERARPRQDEDRAAACYGLADGRLSAAGFGWYELSNWARPGRESRHNLAYWRHEPYEAVGPGAHAYDGGARRRWNAARLDAYIGALVPGGPRRPRLPPGGEETLDPTAYLVEAAMLGLRLRDGIGPDLASAPGVAPAVDWGLAYGLVELGPTGGVSLTVRGRLLAGEVFVRLPIAGAPLP
jgi:oxygen-independent coproporphyrinogen-3 oxidase